MKIKKGFELQCVCDEYILIPAGEENVDFSKIINLNPTAAYLWQGCAALDSFDVNIMAELLQSEYEVDEAVALEDCRLVAERWLEMGLLEE